MGKSKSKVNRCLARYSPRATTTNRPTNRAPNKPAWPKLTKNANFGPNLVVFGQKILFFTGEIKSFVTHITENPPGHLVHIVFLVGHWTKCARNGKIWPKMTKNAYFGPILAVFGPKILIFMAGSKNLVPSYRNSKETPFCVENIDR